MTETTVWSGFDTGAHRAAQDGCHHLIHCAVHPSTRTAVGRSFDNARGDASDYWHEYQPAAREFLAATYQGFAASVAGDPAALTFAFPPIGEALP
jgi:acyl transferase domain-containing protein